MTTIAKRVPASLLTLGIAALLVPALAAGVPPSAIRSGGPSAPGEAKVAIVAGPGSLSGSAFRVYRGNRVVLRGHLRPAPGSAAPWAHAFRADLSSIRAPGRYRVRAAGRISRPWVVTAHGAGVLVPRILRFFKTNRDGRGPALLHAPSHLNDATVTGGAYDGRHFDLTGGWMDAGDMLHFTQTTAYATMVLEAAARLDPLHRARLEREADVGVAWLLKAHPAPRLFVAQVGDNRDHQRGFSNPARDDSSHVHTIANRLAFHWGSRVGGDIGGKVAAALALAATRRPEPARGVLVEQAREWFRAGRRSGRATPAIRHAGGFYIVSNWRDSLAAGAAALFRATGEARYLHWARRYLGASDSSEVLGYANVAPFAAADICGRLGAPALGGQGTRRQACRFLRHNAARAALFAHRNAFGPAGPFTWGTTASNGAGGAIAAVAGLPGGRAVAAGARDYLLGRNPWGASFVAGFGPHSPHQVSSWASIFGPARPSGAVVGGPAPARRVREQGFFATGPLRRFDSTVVYEDRRADYVTSEPALDYAANSILLLAALPAPRQEPSSEHAPAEDGGERVLDGVPGRLGEDAQHVSPGLQLLVEAGRATGGQPAAVELAGVPGPLRRGLELEPRGAALGSLRGMNAEGRARRRPQRWRVGSARRRWRARFARRAGRSGLFRFGLFGFFRFFGFFRPFRFFFRPVVGRGQRFRAGPRPASARGLDRPTRL